MKKFNVVLAVFCAVCAFSAWFLSDNSVRAAQTTEDIIIRIGGISPFTGPYAQDGADMKNSCEIISNQLRKQGGITLKDGRKAQIEFIFEDDEADPEKGVNAANKLIADGVMGIIGPDFSSVALAAGEIAQDKQIPMLVTMATNVAVTQIGDFVFRACFIDSYQAKVAAKYCMEKGYARIGILTNNASDYSMGLVEEFRPYYVSLGGEIAAIETFSDADGGSVTDFNVQIAKLKNADVDAVFMPVQWSNVPDIVNQAYQSGFEIPFIGTDGWDALTPGMINADAQKYVVFTSPFTAESTDPISQAYVTEYRSRFSLEPTGNSTYAYDAALAMIAAIEQAESLAGPAIRDALNNLQDFRGATGQLVFDENRNPIKDANLIGLQDNQKIYLGTLSLN